MKHNDALKHQLTLCITELSTTVQTFSMKEVFAPLWYQRKVWKAREMYKRMWSFWISHSDLGVLEAVTQKSNFPKKAKRIESIQNRQGWWH